MQEAVAELFERYERETNAALSGSPNLSAVGDLYDEHFIAAAPAGIMTGKKDDSFLQTVRAGFARYRDMGTRRMTVRSLEVEPIDALHALARVAWRAVYDVRGAETTIDFTNVYLVRVDADRARVFGWITGDEDAELRKHGIIS